MLRVRRSTRPQGLKHECLQARSAMLDRLLATAIIPRRTKVRTPAEHLVSAKPTDRNGAQFPENEGGLDGPENRSEGQRGRGRLARHARLSEGAIEQEDQHPDLEHRRPG